MTAIIPNITRFALVRSFVCVFDAKSNKHIFVCFHSFVWWHFGEYAKVSTVVCISIEQMLRVRTLSILVWAFSIDERSLHFGVSHSHIYRT